MIDRPVQNGPQHEKRSNIHEAFVKYRLLTIAIAKPYPNPKQQHENAVRLYKIRHGIPPFINNHKNIHGGDEHACCCNHARNTQFHVGFDITIADKIGLYHQYNDPGKTEQPMNDEFGIAVAFLSYIGKEVVRKANNGENKDEDTGNLKEIFFHNVTRFFKKY